MALSRNVSDLLSNMTRVSRAATATTVMKIQHAIPAAVHRAQQDETLHVSSVRRYPDPPQLDLPDNMCDISGNETGRFTPQRARDIALYSENGGVTASENASGFARIRDDSHVDSYDCSGAVNLRGTMQTNVPKPYHSKGTDTWVERSTHLNMPGGQWTRDSKYIAEDMQKSHYRNLRPDSCFAINSVTSLLLQAISQPMQHTFKMGYSTNASETAKDAAKDQAVISKRERFRIALRDYGGTLLVFHITISLISLGICYIVIISGVDTMPLVQKITGGNEQIDTVMKTSTDFVVAYTVHKIFAPVRISITLGVVPILVRYLRRAGLLKSPKIKSSPS